MCLILFGINNHPKYHLILAANRDEFYNRPTLAAHWWQGSSNILGGRDGKSQGTWLAINRSGKIAAVTNYRDIKNNKTDALSRGKLTQTFLESTKSPQNYLQTLKSNAHLYNGFNLLLYKKKQLFYFSNYENKIRTLESGFYGLSNGLLNNSWPKVKNGKKTLENSVKKTFTSKDIFELLQDKQEPSEDFLPRTGLPVDWEKALSRTFIQKDGYGTRCSTLILITYQGEVEYKELTYNSKGKPLFKQCYNYSISDY